MLSLTILLSGNAATCFYYINIQQKRLKKILLQCINRSLLFANILDELYERYNFCSFFWPKWTVFATDGLILQIFRPSIQKNQGCTQAGL